MGDRIIKRLMKVLFIILSRSFSSLHHPVTQIILSPSSSSLHHPVTQIILSHSSSSLHHPVTQIILSRSFSSLHHRKTLRPSGQRSNLHVNPRKDTPHETFLSVNRIYSPVSNATEFRQVPWTFVERTLHRQECLCHLHMHPFLRCAREE